ncbi:hypothetical protein TKK_0012264 [Trichogramma kaykai]|uniref:DDE Tnp4 domain-containing protein n=1 Tax=Trichogramma kaykai TaxID=54128 RepID=A0ABD2WMI8_9HYME
MSIPTHDKFVDIARQFLCKSGVPQCLGAIDGRHVCLKRPSKSGSLYYNYKKFYSIVLQAIVDANYKYIFIDVGAYGSQSDGGIFRDSTFERALDDGNLPIPTAGVQKNIDVPFFFVGDGAYPLNTNLMKPFRGLNLSRKQLLFNKRISRARVVVENAFGQTCQKWMIFYTVIQAAPEVVRKIVKSTCTLHNLIMDMEGSCSDSPEEAKIGNVCMIPLQEDNSQQRPSQNAKEVREKLIDYFDSH